MREDINLATIILGLISWLFGGWNLILQTLVFLMAVDYITGVIAAIFKKSNKTKSGKLSSKAGFKGLAKKLMVLVVCAIAYRIDILLKAENLLYNTVLLFYVSNEGISILENIINMGVKVPDKLKNVIESIKEEKE